MFPVRVKLNRLEKEVLAYEQQPIVEGKILLYGNSGFTRWRDGNEYGFIPASEEIRRKDGSLAVVNHGIGTSTTEELLYYYPRLVRPWKPEALVLLSYANNPSAGYSPSEVMALHQRICEYARTDFPGIRLFICDVRPLFSQADNLSWRVNVQNFNKMLKIYAAEHDDVTLIEHSKCPDFFEEGCMGDYSKPRRDIFVDDLVHLNQDGYTMYGRFMRQALDQLL